MKDLPIGIQTFADLIDGGFVYVDKIALSHDLVRPAKGVSYLSRLRRFGKSLLVRTLRALECRWGGNGMKQIGIHLVVIALICGCSTPKPRFEELIFRGDTRRMFEIATADGHSHRIQAIYHLGDLPGRDVVEVLLKLLIDGDESARHWAADSIGRIGTQVILPEETVAALIELLELPDYELRAEIGLCLARVGSTAAVLSLARLLNPGGDYEFQRALVHGLQEAFYVPPDGGQMPDNVGLLVVNALLTYSASCYQGDLRQLAESLANGILRRRGRTWDVPGDRSAGNRPNILEHAVSGSSYAAPGPPFDH